MKLAFSLFKYFSYGGLQKDFLRIARACKERGHRIHVYTMHWEGELEPDFNIHFIKANGFTNHSRLASFAEKVNSCCARSAYDLHIGFNKMPGLNIYYAADVCYQTRVREKKSWLYQLLPRYKQYVALEQSVFARGKKTEILLISPQQQVAYSKHYQTENERFHLLSPGINKDFLLPTNAAQIRETLRKQFSIEDHHFLLLLIGSGFKTKGLDRVIHGLASLPESIKKRCYLLVIGQDNPRLFKKLSARYQLTQQIKFLGGRNDVNHFLFAADFLLHPAYHENTGTVLLEAIVAGLPVLTNDVCGYAHYIREANAGIVLPAPFQQAVFNQTLQKMLLSSTDQWRQNGLAFAEKADIYSLVEKAADFIEAQGKIFDE